MALLFGDELEVRTQQVVVVKNAELVTHVLYLGAVKNGYNLVVVVQLADWWRINKVVVEPWRVQGQLVVEAKDASLVTLSQEAEVAKNDNGLLVGALMFLLSMWMNAVVVAVMMMAVVVVVLALVRSMEEGCVIYRMIKPLKMGVTVEKVSFDFHRRC